MRPIFFGHKIFWSKIFWSKYYWNSFLSNFFIPNFPTKKGFWPTILGSQNQTQKFLTKKLFLRTIFWCRISFDPNPFGHKRFQEKIGEKGQAKVEIIIPYALIFLSSPWVLRKIDHTHWNCYINCIYFSLNTQGLD